MTFIQNALPTTKNLDEPSPIKSPYMVAWYEPCYHASPLTHAPTMGIPPKLSSTRKSSNVRASSGGVVRTPAILQLCPFINGGIDEVELILIPIRTDCWNWFKCSGSWSPEDTFHTRRNELVTTMWNADTEGSVRSSAGVP